MDSKRGKRILYVGAGVAAVAVGAFAIYKAVKYFTTAKEEEEDEPPTKAKYDKFEAVTAADVAGEDFSGGAASECLAACDADPACRGYISNKGSNTCRTFSVDPYTNWSDSFSIDTYIKRDSGAASSYWSEWDPSQCPGIPGIGEWCGTVVQTRTCTGQCIGTSENHCPTQECPLPSGVYENVGKGWDVLPDPTVVNVDLETGSDEKTCEDLCDKDMSCRGFWYLNMHGLQKSKCAKINSDVQGVRQATTGNPLVNFLYMRVPTGAQWGALPSVADCKCGMTKIDRVCESGSDCTGAGYVACPSNPCTYDTFGGVTVN